MANIAWVVAFAMSADPNAAISRRPDGLGGDIAVALDKGNRPVSVAELPFKVKGIFEKQRKLGSAPWHADGGEWTVIDCELSAATFSLAFKSEPAPKVMPGYESGEGELLIHDARSAARLLAAFTEYLHASVAQKPGKPRPLPMRVGVLGRALARNANGSFTARPGATWTVAKLTVALDTPEVYAELYFAWDPRAGIGAFSEKEPDFRADVLEAIGFAAGR